MANKFDDENIKEIDLMKLDIADVVDLMTAKYEVNFKDTMFCLNCNHIFNINDYRYEDTGKCPECGKDNYMQCCQGDLDTCTYNTHINNVADIKDDVGEEIYNKICDIIDNYEKYENKGEGVEKVEENKKMNLQEATIKALYDGLKDDTEVEDVEGLIDDVLVVTDPEITTDEYNEVIERAEEIIEETPEGDIPLDPSYLGEYLQTCPICGASFVEDHILEPGTACPVCYETPEAFVMVGKLQAEEEVAEDNGLVDDNTTSEPELDMEKVPLEDLGGEETPAETSEETIESEAEPTEEPTESNRPRGARLRRNREVASKEMPKGNVLTESLEIIQQKAGSKNDKLNKYLVKDTSKNMECWFRAMVDNQGILFYEPIKDDKSLNGPIGTRPFDYFTELTNSHRTELDKLFKDILDNSERKDLKKEAINDKDDKDLLLGDEQNDELNQSDKKFQLVEADEEQIEDLKNNSALTWEGMAIDDDNLQAIVDDLKQETRIKLPVIFYTWKGKLFNEMYGLTENNAYPDDLNFLAIDLDNWENIGKLPVYKFQIGARWLDDIVDNNKLRQDEIDGSEPHLWE